MEGEFAEAETHGERLVAFCVGPVADEMSGRRDAALVAQPRQRLDEEIRPLKVAHHADIEEVGARRAGLRQRLEFLVGDAVEGDAEGLLRYPDLGGEGFCLVAADEDEAVGHPFHDPFEAEKDLPGRRTGVVVQASAVRTVDAGHALTRDPREGADRPSIDAALGAVRMDDVGIESADAAIEPYQRDDVGRRDLALHRDTLQAEAEIGQDLLEQFVLARAARRGVADDSDLMPGGGLCADEIADMAEETPDRRPEAVHDAKLAARFPRSVLRHDRQKNRSRILMVSPGLTGWVGSRRSVVTLPLTWRVTSTSLFCARGVKPPAIATAVCTVMPET